MKRKSLNKINVYLEVGKRRTIAAALEWPGWCRLGRDDDTALQALFDYGPRYARIVSSTRSGFHAPAEVAAFHVVERLQGTATADFGVPDRPPDL